MQTTSTSTSHNLTGRTQPNGCAETTISAKYHHKRHALNLMKSFSAAFFSERQIKIEGFGLPVRLDTVKRKFYYGFSKEHCGTFSVNGFELCLLWNESYNDAFECQRIPFKEISLINIRTK